MKPIISITDKDITGSDKLSSAEPRIAVNVWQHLHDIPGFKSFEKIEPITKGWSGDKKYYIETTDGKYMLLRVSDIEEQDRKKAEYGMMERVYELGTLTSQPLGFGLCNSGKSVYSLSSWLDGEDAETKLPLMSETEQYVLGLKAGEMLRKIHTLPAPDNAVPWGEWFYRKVKDRIDFYAANPIKSENGDKIVCYLKENRYLLDGRPQTFNHGDFNISNIMIMPDGQISVVDFNYFNKDHGDPWWEFDAIPWGTKPSAHFYTGLIRGYFNGEPPIADGFTPERGDILIYNNIIPHEDKLENSAWHDHIGIVLSCEDDSLIVAEGNVGNKNISGIVSRKRDDKIGCYIRIPKSYSYDGWKIDFKTGETKIVDYLEE